MNYETLFVSLVNFCCFPSKQNYRLNVRLKYAGQKKKGKTREDSRTPAISVNISEIQLKISVIFGMKLSKIPEGSRHIYSFSFHIIKAKMFYELIYRLCFLFS